MADESNTEVFIYTEGAVVPEDVVRVRVHPSVTVIPEKAFRERYKLEEVELCDGLLEIGQYAFHKCNSLKSITIPSTVTIIHRHAFSYCLKLEEVELCDGLQTIENRAFYRCTSSALKNVTIPSTVRSIGALAFCHVFQLRHIHLPEGIESIGAYTFSHNRCPKCRIPPNLTRVTRQFIGRSQSMFSVEFSEGITDIGVNALYESPFLRNIAFPLNVQKGSYAGGMRSSYDVFYKCTDLQQLYGRTDRWSISDDGTDERLVNALQHRFDNLSIHKMIYYQSYHNMTVDQINNATDVRISNRCSKDPTSSQQDCLGMTPLHIMACSTVQNLELYRVLITKYPESLIIEDRWGAVPLLYAVWGDAPNEIVQFLVESYKSIYPNHELDWTRLVEQLCLGNAATSSIQMLLDQQDFPGRTIDWHTIIEKAATNETPIVQVDVFRFLAENSYSKRIDAIGIKQWRDDLMLEIEEHMLFENGENSYAISYGFPKRQRWFDGFNSKLVEYEVKYQELKETMTLIELVLWKNKISEASNSKQENGSRKKMKFEESAVREQCRSRCGADIVIENVLPYLISISAPADSSSDMESDDD